MASRLKSWLLPIAFTLAGVSTYYALDARIAHAEGAAPRAELSDEQREALRRFEEQERAATQRPPRTARKKRDVPAGERVRSRDAMQRELETLPDKMSANIRASVEGEGRAARRDYLIARDGRRMIVVNRKERAEMFYERNAMHPQEMSASVVDHPQRCVVDFTPTDVRSEALAPDWVSLARLGVTDAEERAGTPTGATRAAFGLVFEQRVCELPAGRDGLLELWWNREKRVPLLVRRRSGARVLRQETRTLRFDATPGRIRHPAEKFTVYARMDISDFREEHVGCSTPAGFWAPGRGR